jgi:hypothetical protein
MGANVGPSQGWDEEDLDRLSSIDERDVQRAREWNRAHMPPPFFRLNEAPVRDTEEEAKATAQEEAGE